MQKQKIVIKIQMRGRRKWLFSGCVLSKCDDQGDDCKGFQTRAMKKIAETSGVLSLALEGDARDKVVVIGDASVDATKLILCLRKKVGYAYIESLEPVKEEKKEERFETITPIPWTSGYCRPPIYAYDCTYLP